MMRLLLTIILLLLPLHSAYSAFDVPHVVVLGRAEKEVSPDEIRWALLVSTKGKTAKEVSEKHVTEVAAVLDLLSKLGQTDDSISTTHMQLNEHWVYHNNNRQKQGYYASTNIRFTSSDFSAYVDYWTRLATLQSVSVSGVSFGVSKRSDIEDEVKVLAIIEARKKALRFAEALDAEVDSPLLIEELGIDHFYPQQASRASLMESEAGNQPVSPGKEVVQAKVKVVFSLK